MRRPETPPARRWLWDRLRPFRGQVLLLCAGTSTLSGLQVAIALLTRWVVDAGVAGSIRFWPWAAGLLAALAASVAARSALSWQSGRLQDRSTARLRRTLLAHLEGSDDTDFTPLHSGALLHRITADVAVVCEAMAVTIPAAVGHGVRLVAALAALLLCYPPLAPLLLPAGAVAGVAAALLRPALRRRHAEARAAEERVHTQLQENLRQLELLRALGAKAESLRRFDGLLEESLAAKERRRALSVGSGSALSACVQLGTGAVLLWGVRQIFLGAMSYGALTALLQLLALFRGPVLGLSGLWSRLTAVEVSAARLQALSPSAGDEPTPPPSVHPSGATVRAAIFEDVTFRYEGEEHAALEHFSARLDLTGWTCLTGLSGRGKTTLFRLLLGLSRPQSGAVYLETDGGRVPCTTESRRYFAYVPQNFALFSGTILENLRLAAPGATEADCVAALKAAGADFALALLHGLETQVREQDGGLSMGQLQRLAIARAVLMGRPVLLLDECTSALDAETEHLVLMRLHALPGGAVAVTHRPGALEGLADVTQLSLEVDT